MPRTRAADKPPPPDVDPEFLALSQRQQRAIDRVFERGITQALGRKRRKVTRSSNAEAGPSGTSHDDGPGGFMDVDDQGGGGFVDDAFEGEGGFMDAGGFLPDDNDSAGGGGGFVASDDEEGGGGDAVEAGDGKQAAQPTAVQPPPPLGRIPLRLIPSLLSALKLPFDDDVLGVFRASAAGWDDDDGDDEPDRPGRRQRPRREETEDGVELKDFRAVCAALMGPDDDANGADELDIGDDDAGAGGISSGNDDDEDLYSEASESGLSILSSDSEFGAKRSTAKSRPKGKGKSTATTPSAASTPAKSTPGRAKGEKRLSKKAVALQAASGTIKLSSRQKDGVREIWEMLKPEGKGGGAGGRGGHIMGRDEVKKWVRDLGEMWTDDEITDMVKLFSSQHEGRGLTYDDFGIVMARAGLV